MVRVRQPSSVSSTSPGHSNSNESPTAAPGTGRASPPNGLVHDLIAPIGNDDFAAFDLLSAKGLPKGRASLPLAPQRDSSLSTSGGAAGASGGSSVGILSARGLPKGGASLPFSPQRDSPLSTFGGAAGASGGSSPSAGTGGTRAANSVLVRPSAGTMSQGQAGSGSFQTAGYIHPLTPLPSVSVEKGGYVPVNADNDNGSWLSNGIPAQRDFNVQPLPNADPDLKAATVSYPPGVITGVSLVFNGNGLAALWTDKVKTAAYNVPNPPVSSITFYVEGTRPSSVLWDIALKVDYVSGGTPMSFTTSCITVTPVVDLFTVTPHAAPSVVFDNGVNGLQGLATSPPPPTNPPGATFNAEVTRTNTGGTGWFIQNFTDVVNGSPGGPAAGWVFTADSGLPNLNTLLNPGVNFPILDNVPNPPNPFYPQGFNRDGSDANTLKMTANDSPDTFRPANSDKLQNIDVTDRIKLYVVWQFADSSIYTLASDNWAVIFEANRNVPTLGVADILPASGVLADPSWLTNADVPAQALQAPVFNNSNTIR
jgi:hypothetical protein